MPTVLRHIACPSCGHRHNFTLPAGDLSPGREFAYVCPKTGARASLRPESPAEAAGPPPQGGRAADRRGPGEVTAVLDTLGRAVTHFCAQLSREGYMVDRERAGDLHLILVRDWDGKVVGRYFASAAAGRISIEEFQDAAP
jgi:hypothetical protein